MGEHLIKCCQLLASLRNRIKIEFLYNNLYSYATVKRFHCPTFIITPRNFIEFNQPVVRQTEFMKLSMNSDVPFRDARQRNN